MIKFISRGQQCEEELIQVSKALLAMNTLAVKKEPREEDGM